MNYKVKVSRVAIWITIALSVGIVLGILLAPSVQDNPKSNFTVSGDGDAKILEVMNMIEAKYVDEIDHDSLMDLAIVSLLEKLDPHSVYIPATDLTSEMESLQGNFEGVGIMFRMQDDTIFVIQTTDGGPSKRAGIMPGDRIVTIDDTIVAGQKLSNDEIIHKLKGPKGTSVKVGVRRAGISKLLKFTLTRDVIQTFSVPYSGILQGNIGYIRLTEFTSTAHEEFVAALEQLQADGAKALIFDLRSNGGGFLDQATAIANEFLEKNDLIVYTQGRNHKSQKYYADGKGKFKQGIVIVMIDESSASASEIVSGAIQDNDRGYIVGRRSFGKGLVQEQFYLPDNSALRLTVARYYTPSGRCIQRSYEKGTNEYYADFLTRIAAELNDSVETTTSQDTVKYYTKKGRVVYGGGGIKPDIKIPYLKDTTYLYYNTLVRKGLLQKYAFEYNDKNHKVLLQKYPKSKDFVKNFKVDNNLLEMFIQYTEKQGVARDNASIKLHGNELKIMLKAYIAELAYDEKSYYSIYLDTDYEIKQVLNGLKKWKKLK